jgi:CHAD domain-containing protein
VSRLALPEVSVLEPRRLEVPLAFTFPDLGGRRSRSTRARAPSSRRRWTLHDSAAHDLARAGAELAYEPDQGWRIELPAGPQLPARTVRMAGGPTPPARVRHLVAALLGGRPLEPLVEIEVASVSSEVVMPGDEPQVVVADDAVSVWDGPRLVARSRELVLLPGPGARERDLDRVEAALVAAGAQRRPSGASRVLDTLDPPASLPTEPLVTSEVGGDATVEEVLRATLADGLARLLGADPHARLGEDPEGVHQLRVATRRLRANLRTWRAQLDPRWGEETREELAWLAVLLGEVRDADVREVRLRGHLEQLAWPDGAEALLAHAAELADPGRRRLQLALGDPRYLGLLDRLRAAVERPPLAPDAASAPAGTVVLDIVRRSWRRLRDEVRGLPTPPSDAALHAVRLRTKRLRYAVEAASPLVGRPATRTAAAAEALQDVLGELQDTVVTRAWLAEVARANPELAFRCGELAGLEQARAAAARAAWHERWSQLRRRRHRRWFREGQPARA